MSLVLQIGCLEHIPPPILVRGLLLSLAAVLATNSVVFRLCRLPPASPTSDRGDTHGVEREEWPCSSSGRSGEDSW